MGVTNGFNQSVWFKPENGSNAVEVLPGQTDHTKADGVAVPGFKARNVFKTVDGCNAFVQANGDVEARCEGFFANAGQIASGGWKDEDWLHDLQSDGDHGWDELFRRSGST